MESAYAEVEKLLAQMSGAFPPGHKVHRLSEQISMLCRGHMASSVEIAAWDNAGLTKIQRRIMRALESNLDHPVTKSALLDAMYFDRGDREPELKNLDVQIHHIRKKLEQTKSPHWIETVWGDGYMLHKEPLPANVPISAQGFALYRPLAQRISAQAERKPVSPIGSKPTRQCKCGRGETRPNQNNCHACNREANTKYRQSLRAAAA